MTPKQMAFLFLSILREGSDIVMNLFQELYFRCFNQDLKKYLINHGQRYDWVMIEPKSFDMYWIFLRNDELEKLVREFLDGDNTIEE